MEVKAYAKVNLTLDVVGKRDDMHLLDMVVGQIDLYDTVTVHFRDDDVVTCVMDGVPQGATNSAYRAARLMVDFYRLPGADISIIKRIPVAAGLGGSSADGVAVLKAYCRQFEFSFNRGMLLRLGSDYYSMFEGGYQRVQGVGDVLTPLNLQLDYDLVIVVADGGVSSGEAYKRYDEQNILDVPRTPAFLSAKAGEERVFGNALTRAALSLNENLKDAFLAFGKIRPIATVMTGSGSAVVGYFNKGTVSCDMLSTLKGRNYRVLPEVYNFI